MHMPPAKSARAWRERGTPIGPFDVLIAGQAKHRGLILVTNNVGEFQRVEDLRLENWTATRAL